MQSATSLKSKARVRLDCHKEYDTITIKAQFTDIMERKRSLGWYGPCLARWHHIDIMGFLICRNDDDDEMQESSEEVKDMMNIYIYIYDKARLMRLFGPDSAPCDNTPNTWSGSFDTLHNARANLRWDYRLRSCTRDSSIYWIAVRSDPLPMLTSIQILGLRYNLIQDRLD